MILHRPSLERAVSLRLRTYPVTSILGPRQCGKTTLARLVARGRNAHFFDLEREPDYATLANPDRVLGELKGLVVLDEIQRRPELFNLLRVLADRRPLPCRFLILGSAAPGMIRGVSESLAGRVSFVDMGGFTLRDVRSNDMNTLWLRGGFPLSFLARTDTASMLWREDLVRTIVERDLPQLAARIPAATLRRFWTMLAHYHGQTWNGSEIGGSLGVTHTTVRGYLDILTGAFVVRQLTPWFLNAGKRIVKSPKVYIRDSGVLHSLLNLDSHRALAAHPKLGASWEGFAMEQVLSATGDRDACFWATHSGAELDLVIGTGSRRWGFEFKCVDAPRMTKSMAIARAELNLTHLWIVHPGDRSYPVADRVSVLAIRDLAKATRIVSR